MLFIFFLFILKKGVGSNLFPWERTPPPTKEIEEGGPKTKREKKKNLVTNSHNFILRSSNPHSGELEGFYKAELPRGGGKGLQDGGGGKKG